MLCTLCGLQTSTQDTSSAKAKAAVADRRREQNRRAQKRFRQKIRERKATPDQDQSHPQTGGSDALDGISPIASNALAPLTPPNTTCIGHRQSLIGHYEESQAENMMEYDFLLDPNDQCGMNKGADDFWTATLKETAPFSAAITLVPPFELKDNRGYYTTSNSDNPVVDNESGRISAGPTVLHQAVQTGNSKVVSLLLQHNADCNSKDNSGLTPLLCAVIGGYEEILELLLSHGAGIGHVDNAHWSALHWAVFHNRHRILERLLNRCGGDTSLLNIRNKDGQTPLSVAVGAGSEVAVKLLLEFGATVNVE